MDTSKLCFGCFNEHDGNGPCPRCGFDLSTAKHPFVALPIGTILNGRYLTGKVLGVGGFGVTYLAFDMTLEISVAVKEFLPSGIALRESDRYTMTVSSPEEQPKFDNGASKFMDEARLLAKLRDVPNIVSVQDYFRENNTAYFVMEYVEGVDLMKYTQMHGGTLSFEEARRLILPVIDSLAHVHAHNLLHRDISPDNIVVTSNGTSRLLDFGAARLAIDTEKSKSIILKHGFAPEEQYRKHGNQGPWSDEYALAATMYLIITGVMPPDAIERVHEDTLASPISLGVNMPQYANDALMKALSVKASDRFPDMKSFSDAITGKVAVASGSSNNDAAADNDDPNAMVGGKTVAMDEELPDSSAAEKVLSPSILSEPKYKQTEVRTGVTMPEVKKSIWKKPLTYILAGIILLAGVSIPVGIYISQNYEWGEVEVTTKKTKKTKKTSATTSETPSETQPPIVDPDISDNGEALVYTDNVRGFNVSVPSFYDFANNNGLFSFTRKDKELVVYTDFITELDDKRVSSLNDFIAQSEELVPYYLNQVLGYDSAELNNVATTTISIRENKALVFGANAYKTGAKLDVTFVAIESKEREGVFIHCGLMPLDEYGMYNYDNWDEIESILLSFNENSQKASDYTIYSSPDIFSGKFMFRNTDVESLEPIDIGNNRAINFVLKNVKDPNSKLYVISLGNQTSITTACTAAEQAMGSLYKFGGYTSVTPIVRTRETVELRIRNYQLTRIEDESVTFDGTTCVINLNGQYFAVVVTCGSEEDLEQVTLDFTMLVRTLTTN